MAPLHAQVPPYINYQGRVAVGATNFTGTGLFKFAIVGGDGTTYWSNGPGEVSVPVAKGFYSVLLGDTDTPEMASLDTMDDSGANTDLRLRVWFNDGTNGSQLLTPDQRIGSVPFAFTAMSLDDGTSTVDIGEGTIWLRATNVNCNGALGAASVDADILRGGTIFAGNQSAGVTITSLGGIHILDNCDITIRGTGQGGLSFNGSLTATAFNQSSDRGLKEKFAATDSREILERVAGLPITSWNFKGEAGTRHIGPMAQDFYAAFNVGTDNKHIGVVDVGGVTLAAIQGLNEVVEEKDAKIKDLERRLDKIETQLNRLTDQSGGAAE